ncbi:DMT family transporter [Persicirhabdus sediminis]|uniref:DMT family transporter n=2 Tax=Persicirhabdus sediminis TaxID=454144 RepID=A0A8J7MK27_9BACT|nr:DMT family transporter [Persicirhabdus sediminis]
MSESPARQLASLAIFSWLASVPTGARCMILSALGFATMTACVKLVGLRGIPILEIVAARALVSLIISYADVRRKKISPWGHHKKLLATRGLVGSLALVCVYYAVTTLPLAEATILQYLHPIFTALLALLFLNEKVRRSTLLCIVLSLAGLLIMVRPSFLFGASMSLPALSVAAALAGAFGSALAYVIVRQLSQTEDSSVIIFYFPLITLPVAVMMLGDGFVMPDGPALALLLLVGLSTQFGQVFLTKALRAEEAGRATAYSYVQVLFSMIFGWLLFSELPTWWTLAGGALIVAGALANVLGKR